MKLPKMPSFRLDNKRALIVGSSSGIGIGCATALADAGASVVLAARRKDLLDDLKNSLEEKGHNAETIKLDISEVEDVKKTIDEAELMESQYIENTKRALEFGIFGVPSFSFNNDIFWGDDRLEDAIRLISK